MDADRRHLPEYAIEAACLGLFMLSACVVVTALEHPFVSPGVVGLPAAELGFGRGLTVRDPDGHVLQAVELP